MPTFRANPALINVFFDPLLTNNNSVEKVTFNPLTSAPQGHLPSFVPLSSVVETRLYPKKFPVKSMQSISTINLTDKKYILGLKRSLPLVAMISDICIAILQP